MFDYRLISTKIYKYDLKQFDICEIFVIFKYSVFYCIKLFTFKICLSYFINLSKHFLCEKQQQQHMGSWRSEYERLCVRV